MKYKIILDFETFYDQKYYTLRSMTPPEYILDPRFEMICVAVIENGTPLPIMEHDAFVAYLARLDPNECWVVSHNATFDMSILAWRYNFHPKLMSCTMSMARALYGHALKRVSLDACASFFGYPPKGSAIYKVSGMNTAAIKQAGLWQGFTEYCEHDAWLCQQLFDRFLTEFPVPELIVLDSVIKCVTKPRLELDMNLLATHLGEVRAKKQALLDLVEGMGGTRDVLMSNDKFADLLRRLGVEPPTKTSPTTGKATYAFAKSDHEFLDLQYHADVRVQTLVAARLGVKSTIEETRTERFLKLAHLTWAGNQQGLMPMPLRFSGAHTHRLSGDWQLNVQNLGRGSNLRRALRASTGYKVLTVDSSQIEARFVAALAGQTDLTNSFANGEDVYSSFASRVFRVTVSKATHPVERFIGKTAVLGLGYSLSAPKFAASIETMSQNQMGQKITLTQQEAQNVVDTYRQGYPMIPALWRRLQGLIPYMRSHDCSIQLGPVVFEYERIRLPNGLYLKYLDLHQEDGQWLYRYGFEIKRIYGGALLENIVQALARIVVLHVEIRMRKFIAQFGYDAQLASSTHDELVYVVRDDHVEPMRKLLLDEMCKRPEWLPTVPLAAEAGVGQTYGDAK